MKGMHIRVFVEIVLHRRGLFFASTHESAAVIDNRNLFSGDFQNFHILMNAVLISLGGSIIGGKRLTYLRRSSEMGT